MLHNKHMSALQFLKLGYTKNMTRAGASILLFLFLVKLIKFHFRFYQPPINYLTHHNFDLLTLTLYGLGAFIISILADYRNNPILALRAVLITMTLLLFITVFNVSEMSFLVLYSLLCFLKGGVYPLVVRLTFDLLQVKKIEDIKIVYHYLIAELLTNLVCLLLPSMNTLILTLLYCVFCCMIVTTVYEELKNYSPSAPKMTGKMWFAVHVAALMAQFASLRSYTYSKDYFWAHPLGAGIGFYSLKMIHVGISISRIISTVLSGQVIRSWGVLNTSIFASLLLFLANLVYAIIPAQDAGQIWAHLFYGISEFTREFGSQLYLVIVMIMGNRQASPKWRTFMFGAILVYHIGLPKNDVLNHNDDKWTEWTIPERSTEGFLSAPSGLYRFLIFPTMLSILLNLIPFLYSKRRKIKSPV
jgi:hypothetical protein